MDVEGAFPHQVLGSVSRLEGSFELRGMEENSGIPVALEHLVLHALVAGRVAALTRRRVHQDFSLSHAGGGIEEEFPAF